MNQHGSVAQLVAHRIPTPGVLGSSPSWPANGSIAQSVEHWTENPGAAVQFRLGPPTVGVRLMAERQDIILSAGSSPAAVQLLGERDG